MHIGANSSMILRLPIRYSLSTSSFTSFPSYKHLNLKLNNLTTTPSLQHHYHTISHQYRSFQTVTPKYNPPFTVKSINRPPVNKRFFSSEKSDKPPQKIVSTLNIGSSRSTSDKPKYVHRPAWLDQINKPASKSTPKNVYHPKDATIIQPKTTNTGGVSPPPETPAPPEKKPFFKRIMRPLVLIPLGILLALIGGGIFAYKRFTETVLQKEAKAFAKIKPDVSYRNKLSPYLDLPMDTASPAEQREYINKYYRTIQKDLPVVEERFIQVIDRFNALFDSYSKVFEQFESIPTDYILGDDNLLTFDEILLKLHARLPLVYEDLQSRHQRLASLIENLGILDEQEERMVDPIESLDMSERDVLKLSADFRQGYKDIYEVMEFLDRLHHITEKHSRQLNVMSTYIQTKAANKKKDNSKYPGYNLPR